MKAVALVLAHANQDDVNSPVSPRDSRTPLHLAASLGNLAIAQLLIWVSEKNIHKKKSQNLNLSYTNFKRLILQSNANVKSVDHEGRTCISYARTSGSQELVDLLLNNGCPDVSLSGGTLPRRSQKTANSNSNRKNDHVFDKVTSSVL